MIAIIIITLIISMSPVSVLADNSGNYAWTLSAGGTSTDATFGVATDYLGNVFYAGYYNDTVDFDPTAGIDNHTSNGSYDLFVSKINSDGTYAWTQTFGGTGFDYILAVNTDSAGDIYVTGAYEGTVDFDPTAGIDNHTSNGFSDAFITKILSDSTYGWTRTFGGTNIVDARDIHVHDNNLYLTGDYADTVDFDPTAGVDNHSSNGSKDIFLTKYNINGDYLWTNSVGGTGGGEKGKHIATDSAGNVYYTGEFSGTVDFDPTAGVDNHTSTGGANVFLSKIMPDGTYAWTNSFGNIISQRVYSIKIDMDGFLYISGEYRSTVDFDPSAGVDNHSANGQDDVFFSKYDSNGNYVWTRTFGGTFDDEGAYLLFDSDNNMYLFGIFSDTVDLNPFAGIDNHTSNGSFDAFFSKYDSNGNYVWTKTFGGISFDYPLSAEIDNNDTIYIIGYYYDTVDFDPSAEIDNHISNGDADIFLSKYIGLIGSEEENETLTDSSADQEILAATGLNMMVYINGLLLYMSVLIFISVAKKYFSPWQ